MKRPTSHRLRACCILFSIPILLISSTGIVYPAFAFSTAQSAQLVLGQSDFTSATCSGGGSGPATQTGLCSSLGLAFDHSGNLWVSDYRNSRVLEFTPPFLIGEAASIVIGQSDFSATSCNVTSFFSPPTQNSLCSPAGLAFDSAGNLWVSDNENSRVLEFAPPFSNDQSASLVLGHQSFSERACSTTQSGLCSPQGLAFDSADNLWVVDSGNNRVLEFPHPSLNGEGAALVIGQPNFSAGSCDGGQFNGIPLQNVLCYPAALALDPSGNLLVADSGNNRILGFTNPISDGEPASLVIGQSGFNDETCSISQTGLCFPQGLTFDASGNLWVSDTGNSRVLEFRTSLSNGEFASLVIGQPSFTERKCSGDSVSHPSQNGLCAPRDVALDREGNLWVADDVNNRVLEFLNLLPPALTVSTFFTDPNFNPLSSSTQGNPQLLVNLVHNNVVGTSPGHLLAWVNVTNTSGEPLQSLKLNQTLPTDWSIDPHWLPAKGAIHVYFANTTSLALNPEITLPSTITVSTDNPQTVLLSISNLTATAIGHPFMPGQSILISTKLSYVLTKTNQSAITYPRNYTETASATALTQTGFAGIQFTGAGSTFFTADAKVEP